MAGLDNLLKSMLYVKNFTKAQRSQGWIRTAEMKRSRILRSWQLECNQHLELALLRGALGMGTNLSARAPAAPGPIAEWE